MRRTLLILLLFPLAAMAQEPELRLQLRRTFGYQAGSDIQGSFTLSVSGVDELAGVEYLIDGLPLAAVDRPPFLANFSTGDYAPGDHRIGARALTRAGELLLAPEVQVTFITAEQSWQAAGRIAGAILVGVLALTLVGLGATRLLTHGPGIFEPGVYGLAGGAVCRRCRLPFRRQFFAPNLLVGKLARCPHCGRVAIVGRASPQDLAQAEERYRADSLHGQRKPSSSEEDRLRRLEDTRFES